MVQFIGTGCICGLDEFKGNPMNELIHLKFENDILAVLDKNKICFYAVRLGFPLVGYDQKSMNSIDLYDLKSKSKLEFDRPLLVVKDGQPYFYVFPMEEIDFLNNQTIESPIKL